MSTSPAGQESQAIWRCLLDDSVKTRTADERINSFLRDTGKLEPGRGRAHRWHSCFCPPWAAAAKTRGNPVWGVPVQGNGFRGAEGGRKEESNCTPPTSVRERRKSK